MGDKETAQELVKVILEVDQVERELFENKLPNSFSRLNSEFTKDRLYATKEDLKHFKGKIKTQIMVADYYYEIEQWDEAYRRYREFERDNGDKLDTVARAYLDMMLGAAAWDEGKREEALKYLRGFEENDKYLATPSWPRAQDFIVCIYQSKPETRDRCVDILKRVIKYHGNTKEGIVAQIDLGNFYFAFKRDKEAKEVFEQIVNKKVDPGYIFVANDFLKKIAERQTNVKE